LAAQLAHVLPAYPVRQLHVQPLTSVPDTEAALPLQLAVLLHATAVHDG
jgi:hypothetical protein